MSIRTLAVIAFTLAGTAELAHAGDAETGARALIAAQAGAIVEGRDAFAATFTEDAFAFIQIARPAVGRDQIGSVFGEAMTDAHYAIDEVTVKHLVVGGLGADAAWLTADLVMITSAEGEQIFDPSTARITELVVRDGTAWRARAAHLSLGIDDADVRGMREVGWVEHVEAVPGAAADEPHAALLGSPRKMAAKLAAHKATTVLGSAGKEKAIGKAKARKLLGRWARLSMKVVDGVRWEQGDGWALAAGNVEVTVPAKKGKAAPAPLSYRVLVLLRPRGDDWEIVSAHYSSPAPGMF